MDQGRRKVYTTIYLTPDQDRLLTLLRKRTKVPTSERVREGVDLILAEHADILPELEEVRRRQAAEADSDLQQPETGGKES